MKSESYMELLKSKFERHFNIHTDVEVLDHRIDMLAKYSDISGRTFITKNDIIDRYENHEFCYIKKFDHISGEEAASFGQFLRKVVDECVKPGRDHMSTYVTGVMICNSMDQSVKALVEKYCYSKVYSFYLKGWCDVRLVCVGLDSIEVITNKAGKKVKKVYQLAS